MLFSGFKTGQNLKNCHFFAKNSRFFSKQSLFDTKTGASSKNIARKNEPKEEKVKYTEIFVRSPSDLAKRMRMHEAYLASQKKQEGNLDNYVSDFADATVMLTLYTDNASKESQMVENLMNFYNVAFDRKFNRIYHVWLKELFMKTKSRFELPLLRVQITFQPELILFGQKEIMDYLIQNNYISLLYHQTSSAFAQQSIQFIKERIELPLEHMFLHPSLAFQKQFKLDRESYQNSGKTFVVLKEMRLNYQKSIGFSVKNTLQLLRSKESRLKYESSKGDLLEGMKEWVQRLAGNGYHGGSVPDEADFEVRYFILPILNDFFKQLWALLRSYWNCQNFVRLLKEESDKEFASWVLRMEKSTQYEKRYFVVG